MTWKWVLREAEHQQHRKFSLGYEENVLLTMIALVFIILKHSLYRASELHWYFGPVPEFQVLVNSAGRPFLKAAGLEGKFLWSFLYLLMRLLTIFGSAGIGADMLCPVSQWKWWKSDIRNAAFNI